MRQDDQLADLVGSIYDAALAPTLWPEVLAAAADYVGGQGAGVLAKDMANQVCVIHHPVGLDPHYVQLYTAKYWKIDPLAPSPLAASEQPTSIKDYMSHEELHEGRFYREWLAPQGWVDAVSIMLEASATSYSTLVITRNEANGLVDGQMRERTQLIAPHIRRAAFIGKIADPGEGEAAPFVEMLDGLSAGLFLVDATARIIHANIAGRTLLAEADFLYAVRDQLVVRPASADQALRAAFLVAAKGNTSPDGGAISLPLISRGSERHIAHVLPLGGYSGSRAGLAGAAVAAVFVHKVAMDVPSLPDGIAQYYQLTPAELRVLLAIAEIGGGSAVAETLGVAPGTVKTHLRHLYQKTGTGRQADLVKLVAGFSRPLFS